MSKTTATFEIVAKTFSGLEPVLAKELELMGAQEVKILNRAVSFTGDQEMLYKANYFCRTAVKILKPIYKFHATNEVQLYAGIQNVEWDQYLTLDQTIMIDSAVSSQYFNHSQFVALKAKDAIVDQFRKKTGKRPSVNTDNPDLRVNIHLVDDQCSVLLDSSGESLHKRGYRVGRDIAPLNEVLAAGLIMLTGWDAKTNFVDPMCGSGTFSIEAAMIAYNIPPGIYRKQYAFERWNDFDEDLFASIADEEVTRYTFEHKIYASDVSGPALQYAKANILNASLNNKITLNRYNINDLPAPEGGGVIVINPPYGERMKYDDLPGFYKSVGSKLKRDFKGFEVWVLTSNIDALKSFGLHPTKKITVFNGALECKFQRYALYEGSLKQKKQYIPRNVKPLLNKGNNKKEQ